MKELDTAGGLSASGLVEKRMAELRDWRGDTLRVVRKLIRDADPAVEEDVKWRKPSNAMRGVPAWSHTGLICTGETYKDKVKLTFAQGASLPDPDRLFNSSLDGNTRRAIDIREGANLDADAFKALVRAAVAFNVALAQERAQRSARPVTAASGTISKGTKA